MPRAYANLNPYINAITELRGLTYFGTVGENLVNKLPN